ncbi:cobalamin-dependent protein [Myxococcota bacterium]
MTVTRKQGECLFVHVPKFSSEYLPLGEFLNITYMPMGLLALAERARRQGYETEIIHLGVEWMLNPAFSIAEEVRRREVRAIGLPLHWHYQTYDVLRVATALKQVAPDAFVFLGGLTASYFAEEILRAFPAVDAVVQGDGEKPLEALLRCLAEAGHDLDEVPNLFYRDGCEIKRSPTNYLARSEDLDELVFAELPLLRHYQTYVESFGFPLAFSKEYRREEHQQHQRMGRSFFPLCTGRGCPTVCSYCGGNRDTLKKINTGNRVLWRSQDRVVEDIHRALEAGYQTMSLCFDPAPQHDEYYVTLFERIHRERVPADFYFECWALPTERFLRAFAQTFHPPHSYIAVSPDSGNEKVRAVNKGFRYTNSELLQSLALAEESGVQVDVFFSIGLPGETIREALETRDLITELRERFSNIRRLMTWSVQLEPGSPQFERPGDFGLLTDRRNLLDFYQAHGGPRADTYSGLGYKIEGYFGDERDQGGIAEFEAHMQHLKCMEFCFLSPDPRQRVTPAEGREHCLQRRSKIAERRGVVEPQRAICDAHRYAEAATALRAGEPEARRPELV